MDQQSMDNVEVYEWIQRPLSFHHQAINRLRCIGASRRAAMLRSMTARLRSFVHGVGFFKLVRGLRHSIEVQTYFVSQFSGQTDCVYCREWICKGLIRACELAGTFSPERWIQYILHERGLCLCP